ncbi:hypothetical protein JOM56_005396 [Amanita muscaria]
MITCALATLSYNRSSQRPLAGKTITSEVDTIDNAKIQDSEEHAQLNSAMATTPSTSTSSPSVTVTADALAHALDKTGLTESVSATSLYDTQVQSAQSSQPPPQSAQPPPQITQSPIPQTQMAKADYPRATLWAGPGPFNQSTSITTTPRPDFFDPVRVEKRRKLREMAKADYPIATPWTGPGPFNEATSITTTPRPDFFDPVRIEKRRKLREMAKADFPNGVKETRVGYLVRGMDTGGEQGEKHGR